LKTELVIQTACKEETERLGTLIAAVLINGTVAEIYGNLGAGKTVFVQGIARGLAIEENITSPTFVMMNRYLSPLPLSVPFYHLDLYRKPSVAEFEELGFAEILEGGEGVCAVEWAENIPGPKTWDAVSIDIRASGNNENFRKIKITAKGEKSVRIKSELEKHFTLK